LRLPDKKEALRLMREAGCSEGVIKHCQSVRRMAMRIAEALKERGHNLDLELVEIGALIHDLGRAKTHGVKHGAFGGRMAREMGLPETLARIIERHVGAGITSEEAQRIGLPAGDYIPQTLEEKVIAYADKLIEGEREVGFEETLTRFIEELGENHSAIERMRKLHREMMDLLGEDIRNGG
jgi:uncharacterized protein